MNLETILDYIPEGLNGILVELQNGEREYELDEAREDDELLDEWSDVDFAIVLNEDNSHAIGLHEIEEDCISLEPSFLIERGDEDDEEWQENPLLANPRGDVEDKQAKVLASLIYQSDEDQFSWPISRSKYLHIYRVDDYGHVTYWLKIGGEIERPGGIATQAADYEDLRDAIHVALHKGALDGGETMPRYY